EKLIVIDDIEKIDNDILDLELILPAENNIQLTQNNLPLITEKTVETKKIVPLFEENELKYSPMKLSKKTKIYDGVVRSGIMINVTDKKIIWQRKSDITVPIASMTKMMTCLLVLEALEAKRVSLKQRYNVTETCTKAARVKLDLALGDSVDLDSLMTAMMLMSANDAAYLVAEIVYGRADAFVRMMNARARIHKLSKCKFYNMNGLPEGPKRINNVGSAMDMARLASMLIQYPDAVRWATTRQFSFTTARRKPRILYNSNKQLGVVAGITGMKTGYTDAALHCTTVTSEHKGKIYIAVVTGMNKNDRDPFVRCLFEDAYNSAK
ncbi:MAG: D-alanyl-D-alanine carboxypeptidase family protein, partial [Lentisphaeria bacterium]